MIQVQMSPLQSHGQTAMRIGERTYTAEPQDVDSLTDADKEALRRQQIVASGLSPEQTREIYGEDAAPPEGAGNDGAVKVQIQQAPVLGSAGTETKTGVSAPVPRSGDEGQDKHPITDRRTAAERKAAGDEDVTTAATQAAADRQHAGRAGTDSGRKK